MTKKLLLTFFLLSGIWSSVSALGTKDTVSTSTDGQYGWARDGNRVYQMADGRYVVIVGYDTSSSSNASFRIATSSDGGETWTRSEQLNDTLYNNATWGLGWINDTCYPMNGVMAEQDGMMWRIVNGAINGIAGTGSSTRDTMYASTLAGFLQSGGYAGNADTVFAAFSRAGNYSLTYMSKGALNVDNTWIPCDSLSAAITTTSWRWADGPGTCIIGFNQLRDMYVARPEVGASGFNLCNPIDIVPAPVGNMRQWSFSSHKKDGSDSLYFWAGAVTGRDDSALWFYRLQFYRNGGADSVRKLDSVAVASETEKPTLTGTGDTCAFRPWITSNADNLAQVAVGYCFYPDTSQRDSVEIVYRLSNDTGKTFGDRIVIYDQSMKGGSGDDEQRVLLPTAPYQFEGNTLSVFFQNMAASPINLFIVTADVAQPAAPSGLPSAIYTPGKSGMIYTPGESGERSKP